MTAKAPEDHASATPAPLVGVTLADAYEIELPERDLLLDPLLALGEIALLFGPRGSGKTWVACAMAVAVCAGVEIFGRWSGITPRCVAYIDGEQGIRSLRDRMTAMAYALDVTDDERLRKLHLLPDDRQPDGLPSLLDEDGQARIDGYLDEIGAELVIVDNLSALAGARDENDAGAVDPIIQWMKRQKRRGRAALIVHHAGKEATRGSRGTSRLEDPVELIISVTRPPGAKASDGAVFRLTNTKARHVFGEALEPFEAAIRCDEGGICAHLEVRDGNNLRDSRIVELDREDMTQREIGEEVNCSAATVNGVLKRHKARLG
jgi:RecA-family ATPase